MTNHRKDVRSASLFVATAVCLAVALTALAPQPSDARAKAMAGEKTKAKAKAEKLLINFVDVDLPSIANFISKMTGKNFIYDESLAGKVTIVAPTKIDSDEAFDLFVSVLKLKGYTTVFTGTAWKIVPAVDVKQSAIEVFDAQKGLRINESYVARLVPLQRVQGQEILPVLQPLISREGYISVFGKGNALLLVDNALNIEKILGILKLLDVESRPNAPEIIYLKHSQAETVAQVLRQVRSGMRAQAARTSHAPMEALGPVVDKRLNALILFGPLDEIEELKGLIAALDAPSPEASSRINVYYLEAAEAQEVAKVLESLIRQSAPAPQATGAPLQLAAELAGKVAITPYKDANALLVMAAPEDYQTVVQVIKKLDRRPRQVFVEAMITEVSLDKALELGTRWRYAGEKDGKPIALGGVGTVDSSTIGSIVSGMAGLTLGGVGNYMNVPVTNADGSTSTLGVPGFAALFSLSEFKDAINVLSTPHILTSDNKEAEIIVGENVPFLSKFEREGTSVSQPLLQSIERKDVGITLRIKPQISEGDYIKLDIYQEISAVSTTASTATDLITTKRSAKTSVVVRNKQTVVIGGLIQDKEIKNVTRVPLLSDIPFLGWLFKSTSTSMQKTNLLVYLTPTIVKEFDDLDALKQRKQGEFEGTSIGEEKSPEKSDNR